MKKARNESKRPASDIIESGAKRNKVENSITFGESADQPTHKKHLKLKIAAKQKFSLKFPPYAPRENISDSLAVYGNHPDTYTYNDPMLRGYQNQILNEFLRGIQPTSPRGIFEMPTGTGKTAVMTALLNAVYTAGENTPMFIIAAPSVALVSQLCNTIKQYIKKSKHLKILPQSISEWTSTSKALNFITAMTNASLTRQLTKFQDLPFNPEIQKRVFKAAADGKVTPELLNEFEAWYFHPKNPDVALLVDEAHHLNGKAICQLMEIMDNKKPIFGCSANAEEYDLACPILAQMSINEAIKHKAIAPIQFIDLDFSYHPVFKELKLRLKIEKNKELSIEQRNQLDEFLSTFKGLDATTAEFIKQVSLDQAPDEKIMIYTNTQLHAKILVNALRSSGLPTVGCHGGNSKQENAEALALFNTTAKIMVSCGMVDEGYDNPRVGTVIDYRVMNKRTRRMRQAIGRATRLSENPQKTAKYVRINILPTQLDPRKSGIITPEGGYARSIGCTNKQLLFKEMIVSSDDTDPSKPLAGRIIYARKQAGKNSYISKIGQGVPDLVEETPRARSVKNVSAPKSKQPAAYKKLPIASLPYPDTLWNINPVPSFNLFSDADNLLADADLSDLFLAGPSNTPLSLEDQIGIDNELQNLLSGLI